MKHTIPLIVFILWVHLADAQSFQPTVIGSAGADAVFANGSMAWTIGEVMTETYSSANNYFTQGFQQPDTMATPTDVNNPMLGSVLVYPNPVVDHIVVDLLQSTGNFFVELFDSQGKLITKQAISPGVSLARISFKDLANGIYVIHVINTDLNQRVSYKLIKSE